MDENSDIQIAITFDSLADFDKISTKTFQMASSMKPSYFGGPSVNL